MAYFKYQVISLDNIMGDCGWEVNDACNVGEIELHHNQLNDNQLLVAELRDAGYLPPKTKYTQIEVDDDCDFSIYLKEKKTGMWLYELRDLQITSDNVSF